MSPTWIRARVRRYAALVELGYVPKVVFSQKDWIKNVPARSRKAADTYFAAAEADAGVVYVNLAHACCRRSTDDTCAHEVVHLRWKTLRHGATFDRYVSDLQLGRVPE